MKPVEGPALALPPDPEEEHLVRVLEGYLSDLESGRPADPQRLMADHPSIAPRLKVCLAGLQLLGDGSADHEAASATAGQEFGDYTLLREVGRGGMGIVYEAAATPDGQRLVTALGDLVRFIDLTAEHGAEPVQGPEGHCSAVAMSKDGASLVLAGDRTFAHRQAARESRSVELTGQQSCHLSWVVCRFDAAHDLRC